MSKFETGEPMRYAGSYVSSHAKNEPMEPTPRPGSRAALRAAHGSPTEFARACIASCDDGTITPEECEAAISKYVAEYAAAPHS